MIDPGSDVETIERELAAIRTRVEGHLDALRHKLHPAALAQDALSASINAARTVPARLVGNPLLPAIGIAGAAAALWLWWRARPAERD